MENGTMPFYDTSISFQIVENKEALSGKEKGGAFAYQPAGIGRTKQKTTRRRVVFLFSGM